MKIAGICNMLATMLICCVCALDPMGVFWWCMHRMWMARSFVLGSILSYGGMVGSLYVMV